MMAGSLLYGWFRQRVGCTLRKVNFELVLSHSHSNEGLYCFNSTRGSFYTANAVRTVLHYVLNSSNFHDYSRWPPNFAAQLQMFSPSALLQRILHTDTRAYLVHLIQVHKVLSFIFHPLPRYLKVSGAFPFQACP